MDTVLVTRSSLVRELHAVGVEEGDRILVHVSLNSLGFVVGAARTVVEALIGAVGESGTVIMPTYSGELSNPAEWQSPPAPKEWIEIIREETQAYDSNLSPTRLMGVVSEYFRHWPGTIRSPHPQSSFTALGKDAEAIVGDHPCNYRFGPNSPLAKLVGFGGKTIMLGAPEQTCSLYYLSQHRLENNNEIIKQAPLLIDGVKQWVQYRDIEYTNHWFEDVTQAMIDAGIIADVRIGASRSLIIPAEEAVEFVVDWRREKGC